jgi:hypothetical protein
MDLEYSLIDFIGQDTLRRIQTEAQSMDALCMSQNAIICSSTEIRVLADLLQEAAEWNERARAATDVEDYAEITRLLGEGKHLPINREYYTQLNAMHEANRRATQILQFLG